MYHSIQFIPEGEDIYRLQQSPQKKFFNGKNTWDDWHLIPATRPLVKPPTVKTNYIEIPGADGILDATDVFTSYPLYNNREGSNEFYVMNGYEDWATRYSEIMNYLQGRRMKMILEDDPYYYYVGRMSVNEWRSEKDWSKIVIDYNVHPYKFESLVPGDTGYWLWDPFSFETGVLRIRWKNPAVGWALPIAGQTTSYRNLVVDESNDYTYGLLIDNIGFPMASTPSFEIRANHSGGGIALTVSLYKDGIDIDGDNLLATEDYKPIDTKYHTVKFYDMKIGDGTYVLQFKAAQTGTEFYINVWHRGGSL